MKIYIFVNEKVFADNSAQEILCEKLCSSLMKYYGRFAKSDIEFFSSFENESTVVYIMDESSPELDDKIINAVREIVGSNSDVKLNYNRINPNFKPVNATLYQSVTHSDGLERSNKDSEFDYQKLSLNYHAEEPRYTFEQVILPEETLSHIKEAADMISPDVRKIVFEGWGLKNIVPNVASAMSFYGPPGTGKSMAAEAVANYLEKKIIRASYSDIESKYHGEGPKMVKAIFMAASREDAVLFIDESDSLLSKRLTNVTDGSAQAINSMRSQLLISLEQFDGVVIFATNLIVNYDRAFLSRLISIEFPMPDLSAREYIWNKHLYGEGIQIPADGIDTKLLAEKYSSFCGREIKKAVIYASVAAAINVKRGKTGINDVNITQEDLVNACEKVKNEADRILKASDHTNSQNIFTEEEQEELKGIMQEKIDTAEKKHALEFATKLS